MKIQKIAIDKLKAAGYNQRRKLTPKDHAYQRIKRSLEEFSLVEPLVYNKRSGTIVGGHQRLQVLKDMGETAVDVVVVDLDETREKALNLALNKIGNDWDMEALQAVLSELDGKGFDIGITGFSAKEFRDMVDLNSEIAQDEVPGLPSKPISKRGDLWILGQHRLLVGDSTSKEDWGKLMKWMPPAVMCHTDPPYGVSYKASSGKFDIIENDNKRDDGLLRMLVGAFKNLVAHTEDDAAFYIWHASSTRREFEDAMLAAAMVERQYIIWDKGSIGIGHSDYRWVHEPAFYASKAGHRPRFVGDRKQPTIWHAAFVNIDGVAIDLGPGIVLRDGAGHQLCIVPSLPKDKKVRSVRLHDKASAHIAAGDANDTTVWRVRRDKDYEHPTQKPIELAKRAIENSSREGEIVLDAFMGSGSTLMAAEITKRRCFGMELDPKYADVIVNRWQKFTGGKATK